jgi:menaquinone-specific isochorismate synthase
MDSQKKRIFDDLKQVSALSMQTGQPLPFLMERPTNRIDILNRLSSMKAEKKLYWKSRHGQFEIGGIGTAFSLSGDDSQTAFSKTQKILDMMADTNLPFLCGKRFSEQDSIDSIWDDFPADMCEIPELMIIRRRGKYTVARCVKVSADSDSYFLRAEDDKLFREMPGGTQNSLEMDIPRPVSITHCPDMVKWRQNVKKCLSYIKGGRIKKAVLARRSDYVFQIEIDPFSLLSCLMRNNQNSYAILYQPRPGMAFISVTPEQLYRRHERQLEIDALSSTVSRGLTPDEDRRLEHELLTSDKLRREHQIVVDRVNCDISPLIQGNPIIADTSVLRLDRIQHLATAISGELQDGVDDDDILNALHPTPAVGGEPRDAALDVIRQLDSFDRGWYAAPIGYISRRQAEFATGIRSVLIRGKKISVFTGAGIVEGSDPDNEWREIDSKDILRPVLSELVMP